jgi:hypothetical protein
MDVEELKENLEQAPDVIMDYPDDKKDMMSGIFGDDHKDVGLAFLNEFHRLGGNVADVSLDAMQSVMTQAMQELNSYADRLNAMQQQLNGTMVEVQKAAEAATDASADVATPTTADDTVSNAPAVAPDVPATPSSGAAAPPPAEDNSSDTDEQVPPAPTVSGTVPSDETLKNVVSEPKTVLSDETLKIVKDKIKSKHAWKPSSSVISIAKGRM